ncbi:crotonyl-CoA carboxylase/reductase [Streptosporangium sp. 'caverna']|uniref:FunB2 n=2 Tax=unclassified Streptosporangium TaxID=2632669 RepID=A0A2U9KCW9_9ACTN|nr:crotonyl-CoA carboxylase/reductase [Streptosporangium sp. 'caverna']AWS27319.1 FunB2 [Streptosporangium sp. KD35]AWS45583.1 crotonyl-CoA carboxylase/reductase [Streptosporangium sp. 'caverna']AXI91540.1 FunA8 [Streptosporangium sp.]
MDTLAEAVLSGATPEELSGLPLPEHFLAAHLRASDVGIFDGETDKDVRRSLHVGSVPMPRLAPDEVVVAVMASSINYNTVWSAMFEPISTFTTLRRFARQGGYAARHDLPHQVVGSDAAGVVVRVGDGVRHWNVGDHVMVSPAYVDDQDPGSHADGMMGTEGRAWGYETNFGGLAHYTIVRASQLVPKPPHLTWEEAASITLCAGTAYRMLVSDRGAQIKQGDVVLVWGATGGLGGLAVQMVKNGGGIAVGVVSSDQKAQILREQGCDVVIDRREIGMGDGAEGTGDAIEYGKRLGSRIRAELGEDPRVAFDYVGRATFGTSVHVVRRGGVVVTCGSSTGYQHQYDNRYLWMNLKRVIGSHIANLQEQWDTARLFRQGGLVPILTDVYPLAETGEALRLVQTNRHVGKVGVLCLAPAEGLGVTDPEARERIGVERLTSWRRYASTARV